MHGGVRNRGGWKPPYPAAVRAEALEVLRTTGRSIPRTAKDIGVSETALRVWLQQHEAGATGAGAGGNVAGGRSPVSAPDASSFAPRLVYGRRGSGGRESARRTGADRRWAPGSTLPGAAGPDEVLRSAKTIAVVELSGDASSASFQTARHLQIRGYEVVPVNLEVGWVLGRRAYPALDLIEGTVDVVCVFSWPAPATAVVAAAVAKKARALWLQPDAVCSAAVDASRQAGLPIVSGRCSVRGDRHPHDMSVAAGYPAPRGGQAGGTRAAQPPAGSPRA